MSIGDRIKAKRIELGWSQATLAQHAGVSQQLIGKLETGEVRETRKSAKIAKAFGMSVDRFLSDDPWENGQLGCSEEHACIAPEMTICCIPVLPQREIEVLRLYAGLPEKVRSHVRGIILALSTSQGHLHEQEAERGFGSYPQGGGALGQADGRFESREDHAERSQNDVCQGGCGVGRVEEAVLADSEAQTKSQVIGPTESVSKLGAADPLKAGPAEVPVIAGSAPATGRSLSDTEVRDVYEQLRPYPSESLVTECLKELLERRAAEAARPRECDEVEVLRLKLYALTNANKSLQEYIGQLHRGEVICKSCGLRKNGDVDVQPEF